MIEKHPAEDVFARVPEVAAQTDPVLKQLDVLLDDDQLYQQVRDDLGKRYTWGGVKVAVTRGKVMAEVEGTTLSADFLSGK